MFRTYCQKSSVFEILDNVDNICRLCLEENTDMVSIFKTDEEFQYEKTVFRIMFCVGIEVKKTPNLPDMICLACFNEINSIYDFKKKCEKSNRKLRQHLLALEMREKSNKCQESILKREIKYTDIANDRAPAKVVTSSNNVDPLATNMSVDLEIPSPNIFEAKNSNGNNSETKAIEKEDIPEVPYFDIKKQLPGKILQKLKDAGVLIEQNDRLIMPKKDEVSYDDVVIKLLTTDDCIMSLELCEEGEELIPKKVYKFSDTIPVRINCDKMLELKYECDLCQKKYVSCRALSRHRLIHSGARPFHCDVCQKTFAQKEVLQRHLMVHLDDKPYICECGKSFTQRSSLTAHLRTHMSPTDRALKYHNCKHCRKVFLLASGLRRHMQACHMGQMFHCDRCDVPRLYNDHTSLRRHFRLRHPGEEPPELDEKNIPIKPADTVQ